MFRWRKWDGRDHWHRDVVYLGSDEWGDWVGQRRGWRAHRPGVEAVSRSDAVTLIPADGTFGATTWDAHPNVRIYIDVGWAVGFDGEGLVGIDMDLDVVKLVDERGIFIDDVDEWEEHRELFGYPPDVVSRLEALAADLERRVKNEEAPFDDATAERWFTVLRAVTADEAATSSG